MRRLALVLRPRGLASSATPISGDVLAVAIAEIQRANEARFQEKDARLAEMRLANEKVERANEKMEKEKDARLEEMRLANEKLERALRESLDVKDREILMAKGLMTSRGIVDNFSRRIHEQAKQGGRRKGRHNATDVFENILDYEDVSRDAREFLACVRDCGVPNDKIGSVVSSLYRDLSEKIHGESFHGEAVEVLSSRCEPIH